MSFYPRLFEGLPEKIATNRINKSIIRELINRFPDKYGESSRTGSVKTKRRELTPQDLADDIIAIVEKDKPEWEISDPEFKLAPRHEGGLSGTYETIFFTINGREEKFVLRGEQNIQATKTLLNVKECLVCYFFSSREKYEPFTKMTKESSKRANYKALLTRMIKDIKSNGIEGCHREDIDEVLNFLEHEEKDYNLNILNSLFNSLSIGNYLRDTIFSNWKIKRDDLFDKIKNKIGREILKFNNTDKWNPMDIMLIKPGSESEIINKIEEAKRENNPDLRLGKINSLFVNDIDLKEPEEFILAISLKEQIAQAGKAKGYIKKLSPNFEESYNLTDEEKSWYGNDKKLLNEIIKKRKYISNIVNKKLDEFEYLITNGGINDFNFKTSALSKYASLKMLSFILDKAKEDKNIFTKITQYGLSLEKNPTFFKLKGNIKGDPKRVEDNIEKFPASSGVQLYNPKNDNFNGKIKIIDSNNSMRIIIRYFLEFENKIYSAKMAIRPNQSNKLSQITIETESWEEYKDLTESINKNFYPRLFEKFSKDSNPIHDLGIGLKGIFKNVKSGDIFELKKDILSEKFTEEGDPIYDMGIGLEKQINDYLKSKNKYYTDSRAELIALDDELDDDTKSSWLEYIFKKKDEDPDEWDIDAVAIMRNLISFVPYFELRDYHMKYEYKDGKYFLYIGDISEFTPYFNTKRNDEISEDFIEEVLKGDAMEYFQTDYFTSIIELDDQVSDKEAEKIFNYLKPICINISKIAEDANNLRELLSLINEDDDFSEIERNINIAMDVYVGGETETKAYNELVKAIKDRYEISKSNYDNKTDMYELEITKNGLNKLFADYYLANLSEYYYSDSGISYTPPRYGYMLDKFNVEDFLEILDGYLD